MDQAYLSRIRSISYNYLELKINIKKMMHIVNEERVTFTRLLFDMHLFTWIIYPTTLSPSSQLPEADCVH